MAIQLLRLYSSINKGKKVEDLFLIIIGIITIVTTIFYIIIMDISVKHKFWDEVGIGFGVIAPIISTVILIVGVFVNKYYSKKKEMVLEIQKSSKVPKIDIEKIQNPLSPSTKKLLNIYHISYMILSLISIIIVPLIAVIISSNEVILINIFRGGSNSYFETITPEIIWEIIWTSFFPAIITHIIGLLCALLSKKISTQIKVLGLNNSVKKARNKLAISGIIINSIALFIGLVLVFPAIDPFY